MKKPVYLLISCLLGLPSVALFGADPQLETAGAAFAPMDPKKAKDPTIESSPADREEAVKEFKGLMSMALAKTSKARWSGKTISDCEDHAAGSGDWCSKCEVIMPHANGLYYFYPEGDSCTLQQFDAHIHIPDAAFLRQMRAPLQNYFGRGASVPGKVTPEATGRHWQNDREVADLFLERSKTAEGGEPFTRFVWSREPLIVRNPAFVHRFASDAAARAKTDN